MMDKNLDLHPIDSHEKTQLTPVKFFRKTSLLWSRPGWKLTLAKLSLCYSTTGISTDVRSILGSDVMRFKLSNTLLHLKHSRGHFTGE